MKRYAIYSNLGQILYDYKGGNPEAFSYNIMEIDNIVDLSEKYILNGVITELPAKPTPYHEWDWTSLNYVLPTDWLDKCRIDANKTIDSYCDEVRKKYITEITGQQLVYDLKKQDALAYKAAGYPTIIDGSTYPLLWAEYQALLPTQPTITLQQTADGLIAVANQWVTIAAATEEIRRTAKNAVLVATDYIVFQQILATARSSFQSI